MNERKKHTKTPHRKTDRKPKMAKEERGANRDAEGTKTEEENAKKRKEKKRRTEK